MATRRDFLGLTAGALARWRDLPRPGKGILLGPQDDPDAGGNGGSSGRRPWRRRCGGGTRSPCSTGARPGPGCFPAWRSSTETARRTTSKALEGRKWDAVVDTSANVPRWVKTAAGVLGPNIGHYVYISSVSVYADLSKPGADETAPVATIDDPTTEKVDGRTFGALRHSPRRRPKPRCPARWPWCGPA